MTCPVLCICSSIIFLGLVSVISRSSVGDSVGTLVPFFIACSFFAPKGNNPPFHLVSFFQNLFQKRHNLHLQFIVILICIQKATTSFDIVAYNRISGLSVEAGLFSLLFHFFRIIERQFLRRVGEVQCTFVRDNRVS